MFERASSFSDRTYGSPRVWQDLQASGEQRSINRVARLMKLAKLQAILYPPARRPLFPGLAA